MSHSVMLPYDCCCARLLLLGFKLVTAGLKLLGHGSDKLETNAKQG